MFGDTGSLSASLLQRGRCPLNEKCVKRLPPELMRPAGTSEPTVRAGCANCRDGSNWMTRPHPPLLHQKPRVRARARPHSPAHPGSWAPRTAGEVVILGHSQPECLQAPHLVVLRPVLLHARGVLSVSPEPSCPPPMGSCALTAPPGTRCSFSVQGKPSARGRPSSEVAALVQMPAMVHVRPAPDCLVAGVS